MVLENFLFPMKSTKLPVNTCDTQTANTGLSFFNQAYFVLCGQGYNDKFRAALAHGDCPCAAVIGADVASCDTEGRGSRL